MASKLRIKVIVICLGTLKVLALVSPMSLASNPCTTMCRPRSWSTRHAYNGDEQEGSLANILNSNMQPVCRIVTRADSKLPTNPSSLPSYMFQSPRLLDKLDAYYNAKAHQATKKLDYLYRKKGSTSKRQTLNETKLEVLDPQQEMRLIGVLRNSLEDAGFELLNRRDIDLCDSLNAAYLLRLSIVPDVSELDGSIAREFYPEHFYANGTAMDSDELLFDGRVLVYWRGYSEEVTHGRLLLPKLDYLQASVVQRSAAWVKRRLDRVEHSLAQNFASRRRKLRKEAQKSVDAIMDVLPLDKVGITLRNAFEENETASLLSTKGNGRFKLGRYGGSKVRFVGSPYPNDALVPFTICEIFDEQVRTTSAQMPNTNATIAGAEHDMRDAINFNLYTCEYDAKMASNRKEGETMKMELLERVSINNLVDLFTRSGRRQVLKAVFEKSELVEPTYEEVVVIWRPKVKEMPEFRPPKWLSELADMFDVEGFEKPPPQQKIKRKAKIEIRNFEGIPMANLPAVLPKTKLVFRPADAFLFDMISFVTFLLVLGSIRLDSPRLDFLALISVALWIVRTVFRYSNKLARYDLLVKSFLTSKISHRNAGALKYIASEAGSQRAVRTALVYSWISNLVGAIKSPFRRLGDKSFTRESLLERAQDDINNLLETEKQVQIHVERALDDLEDLRLVTFDGPENQTLMGVLNPVTSVEAVRQKWMKFFDNCHEESWPGGNSTMSSSPSPRDIEETERWDPVETDFRTSFLNDVEQRRKQLTASLARSESSNNVKQIHAWQMGISSNTLNPAFDGPECQDEKRWHF